MRKILIVVLLLVPMLSVTQEMSSTELVNELSEILNDYETAFLEISQGQEKQKQVWIDLRERMSGLENSFQNYQIEIETEIVKIIVDLEKKHRAEIRALKTGNWFKIGLSVIVGAGITYLIFRIAK